MLTLEKMKEEYKIQMYFDDILNFLPRSRSAT